MAYLLPRAVIVLIAWGTTCLIINIFTTVEPLLFYLAGGVWTCVGLIAFGHLHNQSHDDGLQPARAAARIVRSKQSRSKRSRSKQNLGSAQR